MKKQKKYGHLVAARLQRPLYLRLRKICRSERAEQATILRRVIERGIRDEEEDAGYLAVKSRMDQN